MAWFKKDKSAEGKRLKIPEGLWLKCDSCKEVVYRKEIEKNAKVCPKCNYHFPISIGERISLMLDEGSFKEWDTGLSPLDPLNFKDSVRYRERIKTAQDKTRQRDAMVIGEGTINHLPVVLGLFNFSYMGGSMGSVVGEKILRAAEKAVSRRWPLIIVSSSGGARMQEGILSLMQMAKTSAAVARLAEARVPFFSILADPTFGGVTASFAMLGDIIIAEPKALIGFAGARVIEQTIKQQLPEGFQRSEFLLDHGMIDLILERKKLKQTLAKLLTFYSA
ncbi:MAG TPA: acetyl-CoA carboxylase, carboxyltransferase subunit beta [Nitrospiria bacterium]|jgi:acetyl-CoA carboxylase carboxyl transferase subunit beta|nr:acetyl-CoA carboxylase, carboxyltransferase subunit beta [Nitrospiria bacterium]